MAQFQLTTAFILVAACVGFSSVSSSSQPREPAPCPYTSIYSCEPSPFNTCQNFGQLLQCYVKIRLACGSDAPAGLEEAAQSQIDNLKDCKFHKESQCEDMMNQCEPAPGDGCSTHSGMLQCFLKVQDHCGVFAPDSLTMAINETLQAVQDRCLDSESLDGELAVCADENLSSCEPSPLNTCGDNHHMLTCLMHLKYKCGHRAPGSLEAAVSKALESVNQTCIKQFKN